ncbi:hypothetical protein McpCs1_17700 [Methanocorpusculaceae archaeon Cs1]|uniref:Uncharacterized protein n=1 Tax=Methanorbis rubei TaxID=3028300 RepID=A0AAE4SC27_9EURY|nr:hypothetical protein [Methanocorpusculaceae archaeon Cs1]
MLGTIDGSIALIGQLLMKIRSKKTPETIFFVKLIFPLNRDNRVTKGRVIQATRKPKRPEACGSRYSRFKKTTPLSIPAHPYLFKYNEQHYITTKPIHSVNTYT